MPPTNQPTISPFVTATIRTCPLLHDARASTEDTWASELPSAPDGVDLEDCYSCSVRPGVASKMASAVRSRAPMWIAVAAIQRPFAWLLSWSGWPARRQA